MSVNVVIYAHRKAGVSPKTFQQRYEAHVDLIKRIAGDDFPIYHRRRYTPRTTSETPVEGTSGTNSTTPATIMIGKQADFDFDVCAMLSFADEAAFKAFGAKLYAPGAAAQLEEDEKEFLDRSKIGIGKVGDLFETTK